MKLKKLVKRYLDPRAFVTIYEDVGLREEMWENVFKGIACDIPWTYMNRRLKEKTNIKDEFGTMDIIKEENGRYYISLELKKEEDSENA
jgi:hypothetical protein